MMNAKKGQKVAYVLNVWPHTLQLEGTCRQVQRCPEEGGDRRLQRLLWLEISTTLTGRPLSISR